MKTESEFFFPYQSIFITARPGMGASTLALNIVAEHLRIGKKCIVFENPNLASSYYVRRMKMRQEGRMPQSIYPTVEEYGGMTAVGGLFCDVFKILNMSRESGADLVVYEATFHPQILDEAVIYLADELRKMGKRFIFITKMKRKVCILSGKERNHPAASYHKRAMPRFDAVVIPCRKEYYGKSLEGEIRVYEKGCRRYKAHAVNFDFGNQRITKTP